jgi:tetratricopeptide (TPR) repeat protein
MARVLLKLLANANSLAIMVFVILLLLTKMFAANALIFVSPSSPLARTVTGIPTERLLPIHPFINAFTLSSAATATTTPLQQGVATWLSTSISIGTSTIVAADQIPPSSDDIALLRAAFAEMYQSRDYDKAYGLLTDVIARWQDQPADERAGLYRVRGDCSMVRGGSIDTANAAFSDYDMAVSLLQQPKAQSTADPQEYPASLLGRARAAKSLAGFTDGNKEDKRRWAKSAAKDYRSALTALGRVNAMDDDDIYSDEDRLDEGVKRNPYAAWEWGDAIWKSGSDFVASADVHTRASTAFDEIGDRARSVITQIDAGIALAAAGELQTKQAESVLRSAIQSTVGVESRDVQLLQRVITKEGEGRMALAALLWSDGQRTEAEAVLGEACVRLDQLQAQVDLYSSKKVPPPSVDGARLLYSIDDNAVYTGRKVLSCSDFKKPQFLTEKLEWPEFLQKKVVKLETLQ